MAGPQLHKSRKEEMVHTILSHFIYSCNDSCCGKIMDADEQKGRRVWLG